MESYIDGSSLLKIVKSEQYSKSARKYIDAIFDYARCVMSFQIDMQCAWVEGGDFGTSADHQEAIKRVDSSRSCKHNSAIASLSTLNRIAEKTGVSPVYCGDIETDSRVVVKLAIIRFCVTMLELEDESAQ